MKAWAYWPLRRGCAKGAGGAMVVGKRTYPDNGEPHSSEGKGPRGKEGLKLKHTHKSRNVSQKSSEHRTARS